MSDGSISTDSGEAQLSDGQLSGTQTAGSPFAGSAVAGASALGRRPDWLYHVVLLAICSTVMFLALVMSVRQETQVLVPILGQPLPELCMFRRYTGIGCPGCGMTRCFISLAHGDVRAAWSYNPAGLLLFAIMAFQIPFRAVQLWRIRQGLPEIRFGWWAHWWLGSVAVAMLAQWIVRQMGVVF